MPYTPVFTWSATASINAAIATVPAIVFGVIGLLVMLIFTSQITSMKVTHAHMQDLAEKIHKGAKDFLITEYKILAGFVVFIFAAVSCMLIGVEDAAGNSKDIFGLLTALPLLVGASLSAYAGWRGMIIATIANVRTTTACDPAQNGSINKGLQVAFKSGAVMGLGVTGLGLVGLAATYLIYIAARIFSFSSAFSSIMLPSIAARVLSPKSNDQFAKLFHIFAKFGA
jgi:Na+/H+-translocating membrane pyrophosphatase